MEFKGNEFIRNVEIEKEKAELRRQQERLEAQKKRTMVNKFNLDDEPVILDIKKESSDELNDILLNNDSNEQTKKRYIIFAVALTLLFILTMVVIKLLSEDTKQTSLFENNKIEKVEQDNILNGTNSNEKYESLITQNATNTIQQQLDIKKVEKKETPIVHPVIEKQQAEPVKVQQPIATDLFGMEPKKEVQKVEQKTEPIVQTKPKPTIEKVQEPIKEVVLSSKKEPAKVKPTTTQSGTFIQIGAFTKQPQKEFLNTITKAGYKYIVYPMTIKGKIYNKVLVGPYKNRMEAEAVINKVKKDLNKPSAYILKVK